MEKVSSEQIENIRKSGIIVELDISGKKLSTFLSGGVVNYVIYPKTIAEFTNVLSILKGYNYHLLGCGSNTLISDDGLNVIVTTRRLKGYRINGEILTAKAGEIVHTLSLVTVLSGLSGMEFLIGIPGTVGGAVTMNAGAFGFELKDILTRVRLYRNGAEYFATPSELALGYRTSNLNGAIVLEAEFKLTKKAKELCKKQMNEYVAYRKATQPHEPSLGSVFKRFNGLSPAKYIDQLQMKGVTVGRAMVSEKHCNFIVNNKGATSDDYLKLMEQMREKVRCEYGIELEPEIKYIKD